MRFSCFRLAAPAAFTYRAGAMHRSVSRFQLAGLCGAAVLATADAGTPATADPAAPARDGDWCRWLQSSPGIVYKNPDNRFLQEFKFINRFHYNLAWIDGESSGKDFWYFNHGEIRRFWPGATAKLADGAVTFQYELQIEDDERPSGGEHHLTYDSNWTLYLEWELTKTFPNLDDAGSWTLGYGKRWPSLVEEVQQSSNLLAVPERSPFSNRLFILTTNGSSPFGAWVRHKLGRWTTTAALYSTDAAPYWGEWQDGLAWFVQSDRDITDWIKTDAAVLSFAGYYEDVRQGDDRLSGSINWALSSWLVLTHGPWTWRFNAALCEADSIVAARDGRFWGVIATTEYWLVKDKLQAVVRYHYQGADEPQGIQLYSRYGRIAGIPKNENIPALAGGFGDDHHSVYLGLNWLACGHQLKLMGGIEWERLNSASNRIYDGLTLWCGLRTFF